MRDQEIADLSRRRFVRNGTLVLSAVAGGFSPKLLAAEPANLDVASAGALRPMLEGPLKDAAARELRLNLRTHAQGADAVARSIVDGSLAADVFIPITAGPMRTVLHAGKAQIAYPVARTEMVLVYSPKSRFAAQFAAAAQGRANWWQVLQQPGLRLARSNPGSDPSGRSIIFTLMLAAKKYNQPDLVQTILGPTLNPEQIHAGANVQALLQSGDLDVVGSYKIASAWTKLPFITLPGDINLSGQNLHEEHPEMQLAIGDETFYPESLVFYSAVLQQAANSQAAATFVNWLQRPETQAIFRRSLFDPAGAVPNLHA